MKFQQFSRQNKNYFPDETKEFKGAFLDYINNILADLFNGLAGKLSFKDNFFGDEITYKFTHGVQVPFRNPKAGKRPKGIIPIYAQGQMITGHQMDYNQKDEILITLEFKAGMGAEAFCLVQVIGGD